jgi:hypothetical protein
MRLEWMDPFVFGDHFVLDHSPKGWVVVDQLVGPTSYSRFLLASTWKGGWVTRCLWFGTNAFMSGKEVSMDFLWMGLGNARGRGPPS